MAIAKAMGNQTNRKSNPTKARSSTSKQKMGVKQTAKKKHQKLSKHQSEHVRDALNRDVDLLYNALENPSTVSPSILQTDSVVSLAESMRDLGR